MNEKRYTISGKTAKGLRSLLRQNRAEPANTLRALRPVNAPWTQLNHIVSINSATPFFTTTAGDVYQGYYHHAQSSGSSGSYDITWVEDEAILVMFPEGCEPEVDTKYFGRYIIDDEAEGSGSSGGLPIFYVECPGAGSSGSSGGGGDGCTGCGWLLDWPVAGTGSQCLKLTVTGTNGKCNCIGADQIIYFYRRASDSKWYGGMFETCCGCSVATFEIVDDADIPEVRGKLRLVKRNVECDSSGQTEYYLKNPRCCSASTILFDGANTRNEDDNCDDPLGQCANHFTVELECVQCPEGDCCCPGCKCTGCGCSPPSPPAYLLPISGFAGDDGPLLNIDWIVTNGTGGSCGYEAECSPAGVGLVIISWSYIDRTIGWRLALVTPGGSAVYETGPGVDSDGKVNCCDDVTASRISATYSSSPLTLTLEPLGDCPTCAPREFAETYTVLITESTCACLLGLSATITAVTPDPEYLEQWEGATTQGCGGATTTNLSFLFGCIISDENFDLRMFCSEGLGQGTSILELTTCGPDTWTFTVTETGLSDCCPGGGTMTIVVF